MVKRGKNQKQKHWNSMNSKSKKDEDVDKSDMDDEIDAFHKKRDVIPLDIDDDSGESDEDDEQDVFSYKGIDGDDDSENDDGEDDGDDDEEEYRDTGLAAKIVRQQKYLREKTGGVEDEDLVDSEEDRKVWSRGKNAYYGGENEDELQSSDEDVPAEEEEVIRLQKERVQSMTAEDLGLQTDEDVSDREPTLEEMKIKGRTKSSDDKESEGGSVPMYEEVKKDLTAMSKEEQMDAVYRSAPELAGLLGELNDAVNVLETRVNPLLGKVKKAEHANKEGNNYLEVKQILLHAYCQAIVFYLLLKSEGHPVRDHPVIARIVEVKSLLDKTKELDQFLPDGLEDALDEKNDAADFQRLAVKHPASSFNHLAELNPLIGVLAEKKDALQVQETAEPVKMQPTKSNEKKRKLQAPPVSSESAKMLQYRAALEEKLKQKGFDASRIDGSKKKLQKTLTGKFESTDDFDDDVVQFEGATRDNGTLSSKLSKIIPAKKKKKGVSGDDDLPERDDLGERRWKHELRVLSRAGINSNTDGIQPEHEPASLSDGGDDDEEGVEIDGSDDDYYNSIKRQRDLKLKMKAQKFSRNPQDVPEADTTVDGKRYISAPMEKNRGLTRNRKKQNPRVVKRTKYESAQKRRKGQVREIRKATGPYAGETWGINSRVTKSVKFKS